MILYFILQISNMKAIFPLMLVVMSLFYSEGCPIILQENSCLCQCYDDLTNCQSECPINDSDCRDSCGNVYKTCNKECLYKGCPIILPKNSCLCQCYDILKSCQSKCHIHYSHCRDSCGNYYKTCNNACLHLSA